MEGNDKGMSHLTSVYNNWTDQFIKESARLIWTDPSEIIDNIKKDEFKSKVKQQLTNKICPQYGDLLKNTQKTFDDIKNKLVS